MGLSIYSNDDRVWASSYSYFGDFRRELCDAAGISITELCENLTDDQLQGLWLHQPDEPLAFLVAHSDCDGVILPYNAGRLAERLKELVHSIDSRYDDDLDTFIEFLSIAKDNYVTLEFM